MEGLAFESLKGPQSVRFWASVLIIVFRAYLIPNIGRQMGNTTLLHCSLSFVKNASYYWASFKHSPPYIVPSLKTQFSVNAISGTMTAVVMFLSSSNNCFIKAWKQFIGTGQPNRDMSQESIYWHWTSFPHVWDGSDWQKGRTEHDLFSFECWKSFWQLLLFVDWGRMPSVNSYSRRRSGLPTAATLRSMTSTGCECVLFQKLTLGYVWKLKA